MKNSIKITVLATALANCAFAQDFHFSQYENNLSLINPAATATIDGRFKITSSLKNQWGQVSSKAYSTSGISADIAFLNSEVKKLNVGLWMLSDVAGKSHYGTTQVGLNIAGAQQINKKNVLHAGLMLGMGQRSANLNSLSWDNQYYYGAYNTDLPSKDLAYAASQKYLDVGVGFIWKYLQKNDLPVTFGICLSHANAANKGLGVTKDKAVVKGVAFLSLDLMVKQIAGGGAFALAPKLLINQQASHKETIIGMFAKYIIKSGSKRLKSGLSDAYVDFGIYTRLNDALILSTSFAVKGFKLGLSYDVNTSTLSQVSKYKGGFELSLCYSGAFKNIDKKKK